MLNYQNHSQIDLIPYDEAYEEGFEDMPRRVPDISRIRKMIAYRPRKNLDQIIESVVEHERSLLKINNNP